jgi:cytoskeleton protein RodZ
MASLGQALRQEREARNVSIEEIAAATKIVPRYLKALEDDRLDQMPGGFFVRGIIRTYAKAVGLDPEEVVGRYRAAGLIGGPENARPPVPKHVLEPAAPIVPVEPPLPPEAAVTSGDDAAPSLVIEEVPQPKLSPAARKKILAWTWRAVAALATVAVIVLIWPSRKAHPVPSERPTVAAQAELPAPPKADPGAAPATATPAASGAAAALQPSSRPAAEPAAQPMAPPAAEESWKGLTIEITFQAETWIQVRADGEIKIDGLFPAGTTARAQADDRLLIHTGNAGGFTLRLNGRPAKPLGRLGQVLTDIKITTENFRDFLEAPSSGLPTG